MNEQEFEKAFSDPGFVNMLLNVETGEEMKKALAGKGIDLSPKELDKFAEVLLCALKKGKELEGEDLPRISGGSIKDFDQIKNELEIIDEEQKGFATLANVGQDIENSLADKGITLSEDERVKFNKIFACILKNSKA